MFVRNPGFVYFVTTDSLLNNETYIKIGFSRQPKARLKLLKNGSRNFPKGLDLANIEVLAIIFSSLRSELQIHKRFKHLQPQGEWYKYSLELDEYIQSLDAIPLTSGRIDDLLKDMWSHPWL